MNPFRLLESLKPLKMSRVAILERNGVNNIDRKSWPLCVKQVDAIAEIPIACKRLTGLK